jgi:hypothetical protein
MFFGHWESLLSTRNRLLALTDWCRACVTYRLTPKLLNQDLCATLGFATLCRAIEERKERCPTCPSPIGEQSIPGTATI